MPFKMRVLILVLAFIGISAASSDCDNDQLACADGDGCVRHYYICDADDDCSDESDEDPDLCDAWENDDCSRGQTICTRNGESSCVPMSSFCLMDDPPCEGDLDRRICEMIKGGIISELGNFIAVNPILTSNLNTSEMMADKFKELVPFTVSHDSCPPMYTMVGDQCFSVFYMGMMSWAESREFCILTGGELATFPDVTHYTKILQHFQQYEITSSFWIGGSMEDEDEGWTWIDGSPMPSGSPYWATKYSPICVNRNVTASRDERVCYEYEQAPDAKAANGQCVSLSFEHYYYMSDSDCTKKMSPLCLYSGEQAQL